MPFRSALIFSSALMLIEVISSEDVDVDDSSSISSARTNNFVLSITRKCNRIANSILILVDLIVSFDECSGQSVYLGRWGWKAV